MSMVRILRRYNANTFPEHFLGTFLDSKCAVYVYPKTVNWGTWREIKNLMVGATGLEPIHASEQRCDNSLTKLAQNSTKSNSSEGNATPTEDKTITTPGQEKDTFLHSKCAISVHQNSLRLTPDLELIIKAWPDLSDEVRGKIMEMISKMKEKK